MGATDRGLVRRTNQDSFAVGSVRGVPWAAVCDGMGGAAGGNVASTMAVDRFVRVAESPDTRLQDARSVESFFTSALSSANALIYERSREDEEVAGMGTTAVAAAVVGGTAYIAHVGDSRAYLISESEARPVTRDHSLVQSLVEEGEITDAEARTHRQRNIITRAVGTLERLDIEFDSVDLTEGDCLLLCSDGLNNALSDAEIFETVRKEGEAAPEALIAAANRHGGADNITAVILIYRTEL